LSANEVPLLTVPTRLPAPGVNPLAVDRYTLYFVTPTLSVDAVQPSVTLPSAPVAVTFDGAVGACVSGGGGEPPSGVFMSAVICAAESGVL
jgi:hypothetical protein